jgi:hypothetical protein
MYSKFMEVGTAAAHLGLCFCFSERIAPPDQLKLPAAA